MHNTINNIKHRMLKNMCNGVDNKMINTHAILAFVYMG